jgi:hypothetical protein
MAANSFFLPILGEHLSASSKTSLQSINLLALQMLTAQICKSKEIIQMKATGIVRRIDDLGRIVTQ